MSVNLTTTKTYSLCVLLSDPPIILSSVPPIKRNSLKALYLQNLMKVFYPAIRKLKTEHWYVGQRFTLEITKVFGVVPVMALIKPEV